MRLRRFTDAMADHDRAIGPDLGRAEFDRAIELDPLNLYARTDRAAMLLAEGVCQQNSLDRARLPALWRSGATPPS
jgi:hypothetical protein